jgi:ribose-phosphate pyrophosphokinase
MASTGRTMAGTAEALRRCGAREVRAVFTHAVMAPGAAERVAAAGFSRVLTTDSVPMAEQPWLEVVPIVPLLARAVRWLAGKNV